MTIILGIVLAVMVVMNGALFYVLRTAVHSTKKQVESCFVRELEDYNDFLSERAKESRQSEQQRDHLQKEIENLEGVMLSLKTSPFYAPRPISRELFIPTARYVDDEFFDNHKRVNDMMKGMDWVEVIEKIQNEREYSGNKKDYDAACGILRMLNMDALYELCTLSPHVQLEILQLVLENEGKDILNRFLSSLLEENEFDVLKFRSFVREIRTLQDPVMYIRTGEEEMEELESEVELVRQFDKNISEGFKVVYQNKSYDFSIYRLRSKK